VQVIPIPTEVVSHSLPFPFPILYFIPIPMGFPFPLGIPFPCTSLVETVSNLIMISVNGPPLEYCNLETEKICSDMAAMWSQTSIT